MRREDVELALAASAIGASVMGLAVMARAYNGIFTRAATIGEAGGRPPSRRPPAVPKSLGDVPLAEAGERRCGQSTGGALASYYLRFLPVETVSLARHMDAATQGACLGSAGVAVFAASAEDGGALALARRLRADDVVKGSVDPFPVPCCLPRGAAGAAWAESTTSVDAHAMAEPGGLGLRRWRLSRDAGEPQPVLVIRFRGRGADAFVESLVSAAANEQDAALAAAVSCAATQEAWKCGDCPCASRAWVPAMLFATA